MSSVGFFGTYARFTTQDKRSAAGFLGADNVIGHPFSIEMEYVDGKRVAYIVNPFGTRMGTLDEKTAKEVDLCNAKGWTTVALLALVAYTEEPKPGYYWGEVAIISYDPQYKEAFSQFIDLFGKKLGSGIRGSLSLGPQSLNALVEAKGDWFPTAREPLPERAPGTAFVKTEKSSTERLVDQARKGNKGCMVISWLFIFGVIAVIIYALHATGLF